MRENMIDSGNLAYPRSSEGLARKKYETEQLAVRAKLLKEVPTLQRCLSILDSKIEFLKTIDSISNTTNPEIFLVEVRANKIACSVLSSLKREIVMTINKTKT